MDTIAFSAARSKLFETVRQVCQEHQPVMVACRGDKSAGGMMVLADYDLVEEAMRLVRSPESVVRLSDVVDGVVEDGCPGRPSQEG